MRAFFSNSVNVTFFMLLSALLVFPLMTHADAFDEGMTAYNKKNYATAYKLWEPLAKSGHVVAQNGLGLMHSYGNGAKQDDTQAVYWFRKSAEQGYKKAQDNLGHSYEYGKGVKKDLELALAWYKKAAEQDYPHAQTHIGLMHEYGNGVAKDTKQAAVWYRKAAEQGDKKGQYYLGLMYKYGDGVAKDFSQAAKWFQKSADHSYSYAQEELGLLYLKGRGVEKNEKKAFILINEAANKGNIRAQSNLAYLFDNGRGVEKDKKKAAYWYRKSADAGDAYAKNNLGWLYLHGHGIKQDYAMAVRLFDEAIKGGKQEAWSSMAYVYEYGFGVTKDENKALAMYSKAETEWANTRRTALKKKISCRKTASTKLFKILLKCADSVELRAALEKTKLVPIDVDSETYFDVYDSSMALIGSDRLMVYDNGYTDGLFAAAKYIYRTQYDGIGQEIRNMIASKYGPPQRTDEHNNPTTFLYTWKLDDGIVIEVFKDKGDTETNLVYLHPENNNTLNKLLERRNKRKLKEFYEKQDGAF